MIIIIKKVFLTSTINRLSCLPILVGRIKARRGRREDWDGTKTN